MLEVAWESMHPADRHTPKRLPGSIGFVPPPDAERRYRDQMLPIPKVA
jgi:hypothetical protein